MKRLCVMLPDRECARQVVDDLVLNNVEENQIHVLASESIELEDFPGSEYLDPGDASAVAAGQDAGGVAGILAGLPAVTHPPAGVVVGGGLLRIATEAAAELDGILKRVFGSAPDGRWRSGIENGEVLLSIDTPKGRVTEIERVVRDHHPDADFNGVEPPPPIF